MIHSMSRLMPLSLPLVQSFPRNRMAYGNWSLTSPKHSIQRNVIMKYTIERCSRSWSHFLKQPQKLNHHQAQWLLEPTNYHFTLHYIPSKQNTKADTLLRHHDLDMVRDNENEILLKSEFICSLDWIWDPDALTFEESQGTSRKSITQQRRMLERVREWAYHFLWMHLHSNSCQTLRRHCLWKSQFHICWTSQLLQNCRTHYTQLLVASSSAQYLRIHRRMWNLSVSQDTLHLACCSATSSWSSVMTLGDHHAWSPWTAANVKWIQHYSHYCWSIHQVCQVRSHTCRAYCRRIHEGPLRPSLLWPWTSLKDHTQLRHSICQ